MLIKYSGLMEIIIINWLIMLCTAQSQSCIKDDSLDPTPNKLTRLIQSVRVSLSSQFRHNPFHSQKRVMMNGKTIISKTEFANYKIIPHDDTDIEKESTMTTPLLPLKKYRTDNEIEDPLNLSMEEESEIMQEIMLSTALSDYIEKDLKTILHIPPVTNKEYTEKIVKLPLSTHNKTVILDLDETLIHTIENSPGIISKYSNRKDFIIVNTQIAIFIRQGMLTLLSEVSKLFEIIVFTASEKSYADQILNMVDPKKAYISQRLYRASCIVKSRHYIKDLRILNRKMESCIIVDNSVVSFMGHLDNGIPIKPYIGDPSDMELYELVEELKSMATVDDVRPVLRKKYLLSDLYTETLHRRSFDA